MGVAAIVPPLAGSPLALDEAHLLAGEAYEVGDASSDTLIYVLAGAGSLALGAETWPVAAGGAGLVLAGETGRLEATGGDLRALLASVGRDADRHAPLGSRETVVPPDHANAGAATGARSFRLLLGPHNGSARATLFAGFIPPGKAPWHYHLYDEIVWVPEGPGRLHVGDTMEDLGPGSAFRLRPRQVHIVENTSADRDLTIIGVFTPAGSPSAAYLTPEVEAEYRFAG